MADDEFDNPRDVELSSLSAIYPELQQLRPDDPYTVALDVPVAPSKAVTVFFPAVAGDALPPRPNGADQAPQNAVDSHEVAHLPSLRLEITLGPQYPAEKPPRVTISTNPPWLPEATIRQLEGDAPRLWEEMGRDMVGFTYIDHVQQAAENIFGLVDERGILEVDPRHKIAILDYDIKARRAAFEKETFKCGVCLDPKKGSACHRMLDCGHVFCVECLQEFYNNAIKEGDLAAVRCLAPNCAKERAKAASASGKKRRKPRTFINPSELLRIPLDQETVKRYVSLKYKTELESDKNTVYCPRPWCHGAARSKKHKKPQGLELAEVSEESDSEDEDDQDHPLDEGKPKPYKPAEELLAICEECSFAFCSRCQQSWHGEFVRCAPRRDKEELTAEEQASLEYMRLHTTPCPTCGVPAQKTHGCNHMICYRCQSHFCYLCSAWLDPGNPYQHFNEMPDGRVTGCYMRLWELEMGDGDDVGYGFAGGAGGVAGQVAPAAAPVLVDELIPEIEEPEEEERAQPAVPQPQGQQGDGGQVGIAREGPLVLRIAANQPAGAGRGGPRPRGAAAAQPALAPLGAAARGGARPARNQAVARGGGPQQPQAVRGAAAAAAAAGGGGGGGAQRGGGRQGGPGAGGAVGVGQRGGRGRGAGGPPPHRQNNNNPANQAQHAQRRNANNDNNQIQIRDQNGGGGGGRADADRPLGMGEDEELDPAHQAWVRHFVRLALNDEEDILFEEEDDDD